MSFELSRGPGGGWESLRNILIQLHIYFLFIKEEWTNISFSSRRGAALSQWSSQLFPSRRENTLRSNA